MGKPFGGRGSATDPAGGAYSAPRDPLAGFKGPTSEGREGKGRGKGKGVEGPGKWSAPGPALALGGPRVGHGSLFPNPTQPNPKFLDPTQPTKVFTRPNPTHHRHLVWHIRLYRKLYTTTVTHHRQVHSQ